MERIACQLGMVLQQRKRTRTTLDDIGDYDDVTGSPLLFPNSKSPHWNVDVLRGSVFDLQIENQEVSDDTLANLIRPFPIVEFTQDSDKSGHVLIRLQGLAMPNPEFQCYTAPLEPVTLVFDACFQAQ